VPLAAVVVALMGRPSWLSLSSRFSRPVAKM
jgi:hypothetical protein